MNKRRFSMLALLSLSVAALAGCDDPQTSEFDYTVYDYENENPQLKAVATVGRAENYVDADYEERAEILGLLEEYAMENNLTGIVIYDDGGYVKYNERVVFPTNPLKDASGNDLVVAGTKRYDYVTGYGFGIVSEGSLNGELSGVQTYKNYWHTYETEDPKTLNYMNDKGEIVGNYHGYVSGSYFSTKLSDTKDSYVWYPSFATEANQLADGSYRPLPLKVAEDGTKSIDTEADKNTLATEYRIYVKTGADALYNTASDKAEIAAFAGTEVELEDYLAPYKELHNQSNGLARGAESLTGAGSIKGMNDYYNATAAGFDADAWSKVGIKTGTDSTGAYLDFSFNVPTTPFYAMYYTASSLYAPMPAEFLTTIGGINAWGSYVDGDTAGTYKYTPKDTALSTGPYVVEAWNEDLEFVFKKNDKMSAAINGGANRYQIPGIHVNILAKAKEDKNAAYEEWKAGRIDGTGIPSDYIATDVNTKGTQQTRGSSTTKLNLNVCDAETWEELFGENGTITQTPKSNYWEVEPALSNKDFVKGLNFAINRQEYAEKRGVTPSISYFSDAYMANPEDGVSYNMTDAHQEALLAYYGSEELIAKFGYDVDQAVAAFSKAAKDMLAAGTYKEGDVIELEICWQANSQIESAGADIKKYLEDAFNDPSVCEGKLTLNINNIAVPVWSDVYYKKMMVGQFDIGFGGISGNTLNPLNFMEVLKSDNSSGFTLNWGTNTNSTEQLITYNGKQYTYDALWTAADQGAVINTDGSLAHTYDAVLVSDKRNPETGDRTVVIKYAAANIEGVVATEVADVELWWYEAKNDDGYEFVSLEGKYVDDGNGTITITVPKELADRYQGAISYDVLFSQSVGGADPTQPVVSLDGLYPVFDTPAEAE